MLKKTIKVNITENKQQSEFNELLLEFVKLATKYSSRLRTPAANASRTAQKIGSEFNKYRRIRSRGRHNSGESTTLTKLERQVKNILKRGTNGKLRLQSLVDDLVKRTPNQDLPFPLPFERVKQLTTLTDIQNLAEELFELRKFLNNIDTAPLGPNAKSSINRLKGLLDDAEDILRKGSDDIQLKLTGGKAVNSSTAGQQVADVLRLPKAQRTLDDIYDLVPVEGKTLPRPTSSANATMPDPQQVRMLPAPQKAQVEEVFEDMLPNNSQGVLALTDDTAKVGKARDAMKYMLIAGVGASIIATLIAADRTGILEQAYAELAAKFKPKDKPKPKEKTKSKKSSSLVQLTGMPNKKTAIAEVQSILIEMGYKISKKGLPGTKPGQLPYAATLAAKEGRIFVPEYNIIGVYGPGTKRAVREFQKKNGLSVDGIVGEKTWNKMMEIAESDKNKRWQGGKGYRSMVAQVLNIKSKSGKLEPKDAITKTDSAKAERSINQIISRMRRSRARVKGKMMPDKLQATIDAYVEFRDRIVTELKLKLGSQQLDVSARQYLYRVVNITFPRVPTGAATFAEQYTFVTQKFRLIPDRILTGQAVLGSVDMKPEEILELAISVLEKHEKKGGAGRTIGKTARKSTLQTDPFGTASGPAIKLSSGEEKVLKKTPAPSDVQKKHFDQFVTGMRALGVPLAQAILVAKDTKPKSSKDVQQLLATLADARKTRKNTSGSEPLTDAEAKLLRDIDKARGSGYEDTTGGSTDRPIMESKSYNIDFSKWKPMIKNSY